MSIEIKMGTLGSDTTIKQLERRLFDGYVAQCHKFGRSGFDSMAAAQEDAAQSCSAEDITFLKYEARTVSHLEEFAWVWPPEYAEQLVKNNDRIKIIS